jgi:translocator protein
MNRDVVRQIAVWVAAIATIVVNALANALPINNQLTGDIANQYRGQNLWLPAGYVFAIWGLIYLGFIAYAVFQTLPAQRENPRLRRIGWVFVVSCAANIIWLLFFHYNQFPLSMVAMVALLLALIVVYLTLRAGAPRPRDRDTSKWPVSRAERLTVWLPFSIYLGWITVATVANAAHVLVDSGWVGQPLPALLWLIIMFAVALVLAALMAFTQRDIAYLAVLVWAFVGIAVNYSSMTGVLISSIVAALLVAVLAVLITARGAWQGKTYPA